MKNAILNNMHQNCGNLFLVLFCFVFCFGWIFFLSALQEAGSPIIKLIFVLSEKNWSSFIHVTLAESTFLFLGRMM